MSAPGRARVIDKLKKNAWVEIELREGRKREVRRIFEALGFFVEKLMRIKVGSISLGALPIGEIRPLSRSEIDTLKREVGLLRGREQSSIRPRRGRPSSKYQGRH